MKKIYMAPNASIVEVKIENLMQTNSIENLHGEASSSSVGFSRESGAWEDEE